MSPPHMGLGSTDGSAVVVGALIPLNPPGWVDAGRHLLAGLELAVHDVNGAGGIDGRRLQLMIRDTAADPRTAVAAVNEMFDLGVAAVAGEYHSVVARAAALRADALGLPYLCSSAVLDGLTDEPTDWVARLAPAQSHGWRIYADFLLDAGHQRIGVAEQSSAYWKAGLRILRDHLTAAGGTVIEVDADAVSAPSVCDELADRDVDVLLLLVGYPQPAVSIVESVRHDPRLTTLPIGAPAGQPEFGSWATSLGETGAAVSFLRYLPERLGSVGARVAVALRGRLGEAPSFVAFEGYDTITVLADLLCMNGMDGPRMEPEWSRVAVDGTRGPIRFTRRSGITVWQWAWAPVQVVDRDPSCIDRFRTLYASRPPRTVS